MARARTFTPDFAGQTLENKAITVYIDKDGASTTEEKAEKKIESVVKLLKGIASLDLATSLFGGVDNLLKFVTSKVNTQLQAEHKLMIVNREAGPEKIIAMTIDRMKKAGTPVEIIDATVAAMRGVMIPTATDSTDTE